MLTTTCTSSFRGNWCPLLASVGTTFTYKSLHTYTQAYIHIIKNKRNIILNEAKNNGLNFLKPWTKIYSQSFKPLPLWWVGSSISGTVTLLYAGSVFASPMPAPILPLSIQYNARAAEDSRVLMNKDSPATLCRAGVHYHRQWSALSPLGFHCYANWAADLALSFREAAIKSEAH